MSSAKDRWKSPAWPFQSKTDAAYDLLSGTDLSLGSEAEIGVEDAGTNTVSDVLTLAHTTTGTAAASFGAGLPFDLEDASGNKQEAASIDVLWTTATHGSEDADIVFNTSDAATVKEVLRLDGSDPKVVITTADAGTNAVSDMLKLDHSTSGTAAAGFGAGVTFNLEDASGNAVQEAAAIDVAWTTATHGSEAADMIFSIAQTDGTVTEIMRLDAADDEVQISGALEVSGAIVGNGDVTLGNAWADTTILLGRLATTSRAGAVIDLGAADVGEGVELKYRITDWTSIPLRDANETAVGAYIRMESSSDDATSHVVGVEGWGVANEGIDAAQIEGVRGWAYIKGATAQQVDYAYGVRGEVSMDAGRTGVATITEAAGVLSRITAGDATDEVNIHGFVARFGDMDGDSEAFGSGLRVLEGVEAGTATLTNLLYCNMVATDFLLIPGASGGGFTYNAALTTPPTTSNGYLTLHSAGNAAYIPTYTAAPS